MTLIEKMKRGRENSEPVKHGYGCKPRIARGIDGGEKMMRCQTVRVNRAERRLLAPQLSMPITLSRAVKGVRGALFWTIQTSAAHINTPLPCSIHPFTRLQLLLRGSRLSHSAAPEVHCTTRRSKGKIRKTFSGEENNNEARVWPQGFGNIRTRRVRVAIKPGIHQRLQI